MTDDERHEPSALAEAIEATGLPGIPKAVRDLFMKLAAPAADELGLLVADQVKVYRLRRLIRTVTKTLSLCENAGIDPKSVPLRTLVPLLDGASLEEDESLQDMWASLLASAAEDGDAVPPAFVSIMRDLSPSDADLLHALFVRDGKVDRDAPNRGWPPPVGDGDTSWREKKVSLANLTRLGLINYDEGGDRVTPQSMGRVLSVLARGHRRLDPDEHVEHASEWLTLTSLGEAFLEAATCGAEGQRGKH